jgi:hypothetical protein
MSIFSGIKTTSSQPLRRRSELSYKYKNSMALNFSYFLMPFAVGFKLGPSVSERFAIHRQSYHINYVTSNSKLLGKKGLIHQRQSTQNSFKKTKVQKHNEKLSSAASVIGLRFPSDFCVSEQGCQMVRFQTKKSQFGKILEGLGIKNVGIFYAHLEYIMSIWYILW